VTEDQLIDATKIGAAAERILRDSSVGRCFGTKIAHEVFTWDYDEQAMNYEGNLLEGRCVIILWSTRRTPRPLRPDLRGS
jgi:hypothetical protein